MSSIYGSDDHGFAPILISIARDEGVSAYSGNGLNRWPDMNRLDVAHLFSLALEELPRRVSPAWGRDRARRRLTGTVQSTYLHWAHGENLKDVGMSAKTLARHRSAILDAMRLDIHTPASATLGNRRHVDPARVFRWDNRVMAGAVDIDIGGR